MAKIKSYEEEIKTENIETMNINEFLSSHSRKRKLDDVFKRWFFRYDSSNPKKTLTEWTILFANFLNEK